MAAQAASIPTPAAVRKAERFTREPFVHAGEDRASALAPGTARRRAFDRALKEMEDGLKTPSTKWRRRYSLLLGLERVLNEEEPKLADGTSLNPHQVDALSGTLAALMAAAQGSGTTFSGPSAAPVLAVDDAPPPAPLRGKPEPDPARADAEDEPDDEEEDEDEDLEDDEDLGDLGEDLGPVSAAKPDEPEDEEDDEESLEAVVEQHDQEDEEPEDESASYEDEPEDEGVDDDIPEGAADDPNAAKRFWFEHATGAGKTVAAMGFVDASRTGGVLILTHRRNLVDQFNDELTTRGYADRITPPLLGGDGVEAANGPVTVETYQWFVRNAGRISPAYTIVICDEAHTALGEKTSQAIREWTGPVFVGMTATGALIARHVTDLFPTQTSRFDLAQAARRGVIAPLRCIRVPPGAGVRTIAKVPLRRGDVDIEFDQEMLAELLDQLPFNMAIADLYKTRFAGVPGVVYAAGVRHAYNVAEAFRAEGIKAQGVSGETPKRELAAILARYEAGDIDVLVNAQLLAEGWNSPRATVCMHLAPTASKRIYQQRVGRVTRRHEGKEAGVVVDFVHPATKNDDPVVTLHSLLDRDVYRGGAIVVGPVRRGRGRRVRVERRVIPVAHEEDRRHEVFERELWRIAVEFLDWGEQHMWAALAGARVAPSGWRRARAMLHFDASGELKRRFLLTALERNRNAQLRLRALQEIAVAKDPEAFQASVDIVGMWPREEKREGVKVLLQALAEKRIGRRDQASQWIWDLADMTRDVHEEYAVQRWPETKRLLGLLVNSSGGAHGRNARRLVHASRKHDRRLSAAILAAAVAHTPEAMEVIRGARTRMARKPSALSRELLRNFPKGRGRRGRRRRRKGGAGDTGVAPEAEATLITNGGGGGEGTTATVLDGGGEDGTRRRGSGKRSRRGRRRRGGGGENGAPQNGEQQGGGQENGSDAGRNGASATGATGEAAPADAPAPERVPVPDAVRRPVPDASGDAPRRPRRVAVLDLEGEPQAATAPIDDGKAPPKRRRSRTRKKSSGASADAAAKATARTAAKAARGDRSTTPPASSSGSSEEPSGSAPAEPKRRRARRTAAKPADSDAPQAAAAAQASPDPAAAAPKPRTSRARKPAADGAAATAREAPTADAPKPKPKPKPKPRASRAKTTAAATEAAAPKPPATAPKTPAKPRASRAKAADSATPAKATPTKAPAKPRASRAKAAPTTAVTPKAPAKPRASRAKKPAAPALATNGDAPVKRTRARKPAPTDAD